MKCTGWEGLKRIKNKNEEKLSKKLTMISHPQNILVTFHFIEIPKQKFQFSFKGSDIKTN